MSKRNVWVSVILLLLGKASASGVTVDADGVSFGSWTFLVGPLLTLIGLAVLFLLGMVSRLIREKAKLLKNERFRLAISTVETVVFQVVQQISTESVRLLKAASADGKLTREEAAGAARTAVAEAWQTLPSLVKALLTREAGSAGAAQDLYIRPEIQRALLNQGWRRGGVAVSSRLESLQPVGTPAPSPTSDQLVDARTRIGLIGPAYPETLAEARSRLGLPEYPDHD